jgi:hypothetical protein
VPFYFHSVAYPTYPPSKLREATGKREIVLSENHHHGPPVAALPLDVGKRADRLPEFAQPERDCAFERLADMRGGETFACRGRPAL